METKKDILANSSLQADEMEALTAIYYDKITVESNNSFSMEISDEPDKNVHLQITFPETYPLHSPPLYNISAPWMSGHAKMMLLSKLDSICSEYVGESVTYLLIQDIQDFLHCYKDVKKNEGIPCSTTDIEIETDMEEVELPNIEHGEAIKDRKSIFQAHLAKISSDKQIPLVLDKLKENNKINLAKHNIYAYRLLCPNGLYNEGFDDDGEKKAGHLLLRTLQLSNLCNVLVVVTRWYGGIHLGSDRFRHYTSAATSLFNSLGLTQNSRAKSD